MPIEMQELDLLYILLDVRRRYYLSLNYLEDKQEPWGKRSEEFTPENFTYLKNSQ